VPGRGLEPPWVTPLAPKASASTNFAIPAFGHYLRACPPSWIRTNDQSLKRRVLYQLSYGRKMLVKTSIVYLFLEKVQVCFSRILSMKDFDDWNEQKKQIHRELFSKNRFPKEGEV
jgi:hypothetical protein